MSELKPPDPLRPLFEFVGVIVAESSFKSNSASELSLLPIPLAYRLLPLPPSNTLLMTLLLGLLAAFQASKPSSEVGRSTTGPAFDLVRDATIANA